MMVLNSSDCTCYECIDLPRATTPGSSLGIKEAFMDVYKIGVAHGRRSIPDLDAIADSGYFDDEVDTAPDVWEPEIFHNDHEAAEADAARIMEIAWDES